MKKCSRCVLPETIPNISFDAGGVCNYCNNYAPVVPAGEDKLIQLFEKARHKKRPYDALVPLSGGKDSTYILYLAKKVYGLHVLAFTYDNGFMSDYALRNIKSAINRANVDHIIYDPGKELQKKLYKCAVLNSGDFCDLCGIGIFQSTLRASAEKSIPLILKGSSPMEISFAPYAGVGDINRFKAIMARDENISANDISRFLIYQSSNPMLIYLRRRIGRLGRTIAPLFYIAKPSETEITNIITAEMDWEPGKKHADCLVEPLRNFIMEQRYGWSPPIAHYSNLIRMGEMTKDEVIAIFNSETLAEADRVETGRLAMGLSKEELEIIPNLDPASYAPKKSMTNMIRFAKWLRKSLR